MAASGASSVGPRGQARLDLDQLLHAGLQVNLQGTKAAVIKTLQAHAGSVVETQEQTERLIAYVQRYGIKSLRAAAPKATEKPEQPWHRLQANEHGRVHAQERSREGRVLSLLHAGQVERKHADAATLAAAKAATPEQKQVKQAAAHQSYAAAVLKLKQALKAGDHSGRAHVLLGYVYGQLGRSADAARHYAAALDEMPYGRNLVARNAAAHEANLAIDEKDPARALALLDRAISHWPNLWEAHGRRGRLLLRMAEDGNLPGAEQRRLTDEGLYALRQSTEILRRDLELEGLTPRESAGLARPPHEHRKQLAAELAEYAWDLEASGFIPRTFLAMDAAHQALELDPGNYNALATLQRAYHMLGGYQAGDITAWSLVEPALAGDYPAAQQASLRRLAAQIALQRDDFAEAEYHARQVSLLDPQQGKEKLVHIAASRQVHEESGQHFLSEFAAKPPADLGDEAWQAITLWQFAPSPASRQALEAARAHLESALLEKNDDGLREKLVQIHVGLRDFAAAEAHGQQLQEHHASCQYDLDYARFRREVDARNVAMLSDSIGMAVARGEPELARLRLERLAELEPDRAAEVRRRFADQLG